MSGRMPYDNGEFALEIQLMGHRRPHYWLIVTDEATSEPGEYDGVVGYIPTHFPDMRPVIDADTDNLARIGQRRQENQLRLVTWWLIKALQ